MLGSPEAVAESAQKADHVTMQCIRCGADIHQDGRMFVTSGGDFVCPASASGEAAVHRVGATPPVLPKSRPFLGPVVKGALGFAAGRFIGDRLFGGAPKSVPMQPLPPGASLTEQAANYFQSRQGG